MSTVEVLDGLERKLSIDVPVESVKKAFETAYLKIRQQANLKGFRKGKAPLSTIKQLYKERITGDVLQDLINTTYQEALKQHQLTPVDQPKVDFKDIDEEKNFSYTAQFEIKPQVVINKFEGLKIQKEKFVINPQQVEEALKGMQQNMSETVPLIEDRPCQMGDVVSIDFDGLMNGAPLEGGQAKDHQLELGSNSFIPGFEEALTGMRLNESREINLKFPEDYHVKEIAGQPVLFKVTVNKILKKVLPELNDEFAQKIDAQFETLDALKKKIELNIETDETRRIQNELRERVLKVLVANNPVEVPKSLHQAQKDHMIEDLKRKMSQQAQGEFDFQEYVEKWNSDFDKTASFIIQSHYLIDELAEKHRLQAQPEDIENKLREYSMNTGFSLTQLKEHYHKPENFSQIHFQVTEEKAVQFILDKAQIEEVEKDQIKEI